ncbi:MAG: porin family protein [Alphaproteobacteria bacterium]|nr:porin family protein [Alphaproteobacteria bacterium]
MKKILLTSLIATMATFASNAAVSPYVSAHLGYTHATIELSGEASDYTMGEWVGDKFAFDVSGAFGVKYDLSPDFALRGELEYDYVEGFVLSTSGIWNRSHTLLANAYLDFKTMSAFTPYFGIGAGYQFNHLSKDWFGAGATPHVFAWQIGGGVAYNITNALSVDLGYRYLTSAKKFEDSGYKYKLVTDYHQFRLGANYAF